MAEDIWSILEIGPTENPEQLKRAYRKKLISVNPEDDPEGFKKLRKAYEEAQRLALHPSNHMDASPISLWLERLQGVYESLPRRLNPQEWEHLLKAEVCLCPDTCMEARDALLSFLLTHCRIPREIWLLIDREFGLESGKASLYRVFPRGCVDYILTQLHMPAWFDYTLFQGKDKADYDRFLDLYEKIRSSLLSGDLENLDSLFHETDSLSIQHPYLEMDRARYMAARSHPKEALCLARSFCLPASGNDWLLFSLAEIEWRTGETESARIHLEALLERNPRDYGALLYMAKYCNQKGDYEAAKEYVKKALYIYRNVPELLEELKAANRRLIDIYKNELTDRPGDSKTRLALLQCLLQNRRFEEGLGLTEHFTPEKGQENSYLELCARLSCGAGLFEEALRYAEELLHLGKTEEERSAARELLGCVYREMAQNPPPAKKQVLLNKALEAFGTVPPSGSRLLNQADIYLELSQYRSCVDICDRIGRSDPVYLPACLLRQKAFYLMGSTDEVMNEFFHIYLLSPSCADIYVYALKSLFSARRLGELRTLLHLASEQSICSPEFLLEKLRVSRYLAGSPSEEEKIVAQLGQLEEYCRKSGASSSVIASVLHEKVLGLMNTNHYKTALKEINRALAMLPESAEIQRTKGDILMELGRCSRALAPYLFCLERYPSNAHYQERAGLCYEKLGEPEKALVCFKEVLRQNPGHPRVNSYIVRCYIRLLQETEDKKYVDLAVPFAKRQLALEPRSLYYTEAGQLYMEAGWWDIALTYFLSGIRANPANIYAYNYAGCAYRTIGSYEKAADMFETAVSLLAGNESPLPYRNLGGCLEQMGDYEKALNAYQSNSRLFPKDAECRRRAAAVLIRMGRFQEALSCLEELLSMPRASKSRTLADIGGLYLLTGDRERALSFLNRAVQAEGHKDGYAMRVLGGFHKACGNPESALLCFKKTLAAGSKPIGDCVDIVKLYSIMKNKREVKKWFDRAMGAITKFRGSLESFTDSPHYGPKRLCLAGDLYFYSGDRDRAEAFYRRIDQISLCRDCLHSSCRKSTAALRRFCDGKGAKS